MYVKRHEAAEENFFLGGLLAYQVGYGNSERTRFECQEDHSIAFFDLIAQDADVASLEKH